MNRFLLVLASLLLFCLRPASAQPSGTADSEGPKVMSESAYRVRLLLAFEDHPFFSASRREMVRRLLSEHVGRVVGPAWELAIADPSERLRQRVTNDFAQLDPTEVRESALGYDKLFLMRVRFAFGRLKLAGREYDAATRHVGPVFEADVAAPPAVTHVMLKLCFRMFSPLARVDRAESRTVTFTLRGGKVRLNDPDLAWAPPGRPFSIFRRVFRRDGEPPEVSPVPWTFVEVDETRDAIMTATIRSRLRRPFTRRTGSRNEIVALGLNPTGKPTKVGFHDEADDRPLLGYSAVLQPLGGDGEVVSLDLDRSGTLPVPPQGKGLVRLFLRQGDRNVAFLYLLPGQESEITVPINAREEVLAFSSELKALEAEFVDLAASRNILVRSIEGHLAQVEIGAAEALLAELRSLPTKFDFARKLNAFISTLPSSEGQLLPKELEERVAELKSQIDKHLDQALIGRVDRKVRQVRLEARSNQRTRDRQAGERSS